MGGHESSRKVLTQSVVESRITLRPEDQTSTLALEFEKEALVSLMVRLRP